MAKKTQVDLQRIGHYAFLVGAIIAILAALFSGAISDVAVVTTLVILGIIVGILNITVQETTPFLVATIALLLAGVVNLGIIPVVGVYIRAILSNLVVFVVPAAVIVALKAIWLLARKR